MQSKTIPTTRNQTTKDLQNQAIHVKFANATNRGMERQLKPLMPKINPRSFTSDGSPFPPHMRPMYTR